MSGADELIAHGISCEATAAIDFATACPAEDAKPAWKKLSAAIVSATTSFRIGECADRLPSPEHLKTRIR